MYAEPESAPLSSSRCAPTIAYSPLIETLQPNWSIAAPSDAVSFASSAQLVPLLLNMYAEPESIPLSSSQNAHTIA